MRDKRVIIVLWFGHFYFPYPFTSVGVIDPFSQIYHIQHKSFLVCVWPNQPASRCSAQYQGAVPARIYPSARPDACPRVCRGVWLLSDSANRSLAELFASLDDTSIHKPCTKREEQGPLASKRAAKLGVLLRTENVERHTRLVLGLVN